MSSAEVLVFEAIANTRGRTEPVEGALYRHLEPLVPELKFSAPTHFRERDVRG